MIHSFLFSVEDHNRRVWNMHCTVRFLFPLFVIFFVRLSEHAPPLPYHLKAFADVEVSSTTLSLLLFWFECKRVEAGHLEQNSILILQRLLVVLEK